MLFASATVWGMVPNDEHQNFGNKRKFSQIEENSGERFPDLRKLTGNSSDLLSRSIKSAVIVGISSDLPFLSLFESPSFCALETLKIIDTDHLIHEWTREMTDAFGMLISKVSSTLKKLDLSKTGIYRLPESIRECEKLEYLDISTTPYLEELPKEVFDLVNLRHLDYGYKEPEDCFHDADLTNIGKLSNLEYLNLCGRMGIEEISPEIGNLKNLKVLILEATCIETLPSTIENLTNLRELDLSACDFTEIPAEIGKLRNLEKLRIECNDLKSIPEEILNLFRMQIKKTNELIAELTNDTVVRYLLARKNKAKMDDNTLKELVEETRSKEEELEGRRSEQQKFLEELMSYSENYSMSEDTTDSEISRGVDELFRELLMSEDTTDSEN